MKNNLFVQLTVSNNNNICSLTTCNQLTQQPSNTSSKKVSGDQLKSVLHSVPPDCNKTLPVNAKRTRSRIFFNVRKWTKSTQSIFLSVKYHSLKPVLFT